MKILAVGCEFEPVEGWEGIMPAIKAPSNYKKPEAISGYVEKRLAELRGGKAAVDAVVGTISKAVVIDHNFKVVCEVAGTDAGANTLLALSPDEDCLVFGIGLRRALRLMAFDLAIRDGSLPSRTQWALDLDTGIKHVRGFIDPVSRLFGSADMDIGAIARRVGYDLQLHKDLGAALGLAQFALRLGELLGLGG